MKTTLPINALSWGRHFFRCGDCLASIAIQTDADSKGVDTPSCPHCSGALSWVGRVEERSGIYCRSVAECPCDSRCTNAPGPKCDCSCGGKNHGVGVLWALRQVPGAALPTLEARAASATNRSAEFAKAGAQWRALVADFRAAFAVHCSPVIVRTSGRRYLSAELLSALTAARRAEEKSWPILRGKTNARVSALIELTCKIREIPVDAK